MKRKLLYATGHLLAVLLAAVPVRLMSQQALTWDQIRAKFESANPVLKADALSVEETRAAQVSAYLRPNPQFTLSADGTQIAPNNGVWTPFKGTYEQPNLSYLHERNHKRELRLESAKEQTQIAESDHEDLKRSLEFSLHTAFVNTLQAKAIYALAKTDLDYYDHVIQISRDRFDAGDIAQIDLDRVELQRVQYESELQTSLVNLRTAKIQLLQMLNDRTPVEQFDVQGSFDFSDQLKTLDEFRQIALDSRPDLRAALQSIQQSQTNHKLAIANGSTDPTFGAWYTYNSSNNNPSAVQTVGASVSVPLRIFDRNQGEKQRTLIEIGRAQQASEATRAQVFSDVDSAYATVQGEIELLKPYRATYKDQSLRVRDTVTYAYEHGGASLLDMLSAQSDYRQIQTSYLQLVGAYLNAAGQLNLAVGREVIP